MAADDSGWSPFAGPGRRLNDGDEKAAVVVVLDSPPREQRASSSSGSTMNPFEVATCSAHGLTLVDRLEACKVVAASWRVRLGNEDEIMPDTCPEKMGAEEKQNFLEDVDEFILKVTMLVTQAKIHPQAVDLMEVRFSELKERMNQINKQLSPESTLGYSEATEEIKADSTSLLPGSPTETYDLDSAIDDLVKMGEQQPLMDESPTKKRRLTRKTTPNFGHDVDDDYIE